MLRKRIQALAAVLALSLALTACDTPELRLTADTAQEEEENGDMYIAAVKEKKSSAFPDIGYGEAFADFFSDGEWVCYRGKLREFDEDGDRRSDGVVRDALVVEFTGKCTYEGETASVKIQFSKDQDDVFSERYLSIDGVPQSRRTLEELLGKIFGKAAEKAAQTTTTTEAATTVEPTGSGTTKAETTTPAPQTTVPQTTVSVTPVQTTTTAPVSPEEQYIGRWKKYLPGGNIEFVTVNEDGTGYIMSTAVSPKMSETDPDRPYYDGKAVNFEWRYDSANGNIEAVTTVDPYCFVAYQGYAAPGHYSYATCFGEAKGSHNYSFSYQSQDEYICDMLGLNTIREIKINSSVFWDYWSKCLNLFDKVWGRYFSDTSSLDLSDYEKALPNVKSDYDSSSYLQSIYEDADLYHFKVFTDYIIPACGYSPEISLSIDLSGFDRIG